MNARERVLAVLKHEDPDRIPFHDSLWVSTIERWHSEGLPTDIFPAEYLDFEIVNYGADTSPPHFPVRALEETDEYILVSTPFGGKRRDHKNYASTPQIVDYPCKNREDWEKLKKRLRPDKNRVDW